MTNPMPGGDHLSGGEMGEFGVDVVLGLACHYLAGAEPFGQEVGPYGFTVVSGSLEIYGAGAKASFFHATERGKPKLHGGIDSRYAPGLDAALKFDEYIQDLVVLGADVTPHKMQARCVKAVDFKGSSASVSVSLAVDRRPNYWYTAATFALVRGFGDRVNISQELHVSTHPITGETNTRNHLGIFQPATPERRHMLFAAAGWQRLAQAVLNGDPPVNRVLTPSEWKTLLEDDLHRGLLLTADKINIETFIEKIGG